MGRNFFTKYVILISVPMNYNMPWCRVCLCRFPGCKVRARPATRSVIATHTTSNEMCKKYHCFQDTVADHFLRKNIDTFTLHIPILRSWHMNTFMHVLTFTLVLVY